MKRFILLFLITYGVLEGLILASPTQTPKQQNVSHALLHLQTLQGTTDRLAIVDALENATTALQTLAAIPADGLAALLKSVEALELQMLVFNAGPIDLHQLTSNTVDQLLARADELQHNPIETLHKTIGQTLHETLKPHETAQQQLLLIHLERLIATLLHKIIWNPGDINESWKQLHSCLNSITAFPLPSHATTHLCATACSKFAQFMDMFYDAIKINQLPVLRAQIKQDSETLTRALGHTAPVIMSVLENALNQCEINARALQQGINPTPDQQFLTALTLEPTEKPTEKVEQQFRNKRRKRKRI